MKLFRYFAGVAGALFIALAAGCVAPAYAATPIPLTTPAGVCQFQADSYTTSPLSARGSFGPGCPGYVAPPPSGGALPGSCPPPVFAQRQIQVNTKFGQNGAPALKTTGDQIFNFGATTATTPFPWVGNRSVTLGANANQYIAIPFDVPANLPPRYAGQFGFFDTNYLGSPPFPDGNGAAYSVSTCPGDFSVPPECKKQWSGQDGDYIVISGPGNTDRGICHITPGRTYYLNIVNGTVAAPATNKCAGSTCAVSMAYFRLQ